MLLAYDMTFLIVLLTGLYELPNEKTKFTCALHPTQKRIAWINDATKYAADMNLILAYHNLIDDWNDDRSYTKKAFAKMLDKTEFRMDQIQKQLGKGFLNATDIAEHFAKQGIPFREAHAIVGHMVKVCENKSCDFEDLTDEELQAIDKRVTKETLGDISIKTCVNARMSFGGTAPSEVRRQIEVGRQWLNGLER